MHLGLSLTYYTGLQDQVPHVPEECMYQGGMQQSEDATLTVPMPGLGGPHHLRRLIFYPRDTIGDMTYIYYTICVNGDFYTDRTQVRIRMADFRDTHLYYSKVELAIEAPADANREELDARASFVMDKLLTELVRTSCLWTRVADGWLFRLHRSVRQQHHHKARLTNQTAARDPGHKVVGHPGLPWPADRPQCHLLPLAKQPVLGLRVLCSVAEPASGRGGNRPPLPARGTAHGLPSPPRWASTSRVEAPSGEPLPTAKTTFRTSLGPIRNKSRRRFDLRLPSAFRGARKNGFLPPRKAKNDHDRLRRSSPPHGSIRRLTCRLSDPDHSLELEKLALTARMADVQCVLQASSEGVVVGKCFPGENDHADSTR